MTSIRIGCGIGIGKGNNNTISLSAANQTTVVPEIGTLSSYSHTTTHYVLNSDGYYQEIPINGFVSRGARTVQQLLAATDAPATQTLTSQKLGTYVLMCSGTGEISVSGATDGSYGTITVSGNTKRLAFTATVAQNITVTVTSAPTWFSLEYTSHRSSPTVPSEYVSKGTLASPYHGAGVDGLKVFTTALANTVDGNGVVTFAQGAALSGVLGGQSQPSRTNLRTYSRTFSNAVYTKTAVTLTSATHESPYGTNDAQLITIDNATHELSSTVTVTASTIYTISWLVKRGTATGLKYAVDDVTNAATITAATSYYSETNSSTWTLISKTFTTPVGCVSIKVHLLKDGGATGTVYIDNHQVEAGSYATDPIPTTTGAVTRSAITYAINWPTGLVNNFEIEFDVYIASKSTNINERLFGVGVSGVNAINAYIWTNGKIMFELHIASIAYYVESDSTVTAGTSYTFRFTYSVSAKMYINDVQQVDTAAISTNMGWSDPEILYLGAHANNTSNSYTCIENFVVRRV